MELIKNIINKIITVFNMIFLLPHNLIVFIYIMGIGSYSYIINKKRRAEEGDGSHLADEKDVEVINQFTNETKIILQKTQNIKYIFCSIFWIIIYYLINK